MTGFAIEQKAVDATQLGGTTTGGTNAMNDMTARETETGAAGTVQRLLSQTNSFFSFARLAPLLVVCVLGLAACGGGDDDLPPPDAEFAVDPNAAPVDVLYNNALTEMEAGNYTAAAAAYEEVERQHPYSQWATRSMFMTAYAYYQARRYDDAIIAAERFIDWHPGNENVPYAQYLIGMCHYEQISDVGRDQRNTVEAQAAFEDLVGRYPRSPYARDADLKLDLISDHLAGKEMEVGRYYLNREEYVAAVNRFTEVIDDYQTTTHVPEALHRLVESFVALGLDDDARRTAAVLGFNYPGSPWYERTYNLVNDPDLPPLSDS